MGISFYFLSFIFILLNLSCTTLTKESQIEGFKPNSTEQLKCSPEFKENQNDFLLVNSPQKINWGELLPLCLLLKKQDTENRNFYLGAEIKLPESIKGASYANFQKPLPQSNIKLKNKIEQEILKNGKAFFSFEIESEYLIPGEYVLTLQYSHGKMYEKLVPFKVEPYGWRKDLIKHFKNWICKEDLLKSMSDYIKALQRGQIETPASRYALESLHRNIWKGWKKGFEAFSLKLSKEIIKNWKNTDYSADNIFAHYISKQIPDCPAPSTSADIKADLEYIFYGLRNYQDENPPSYVDSPNYQDLEEIK